MDLEAPSSVSVTPASRSLTFLSLPGEIRNDIYDLAFTTPGQKTLRRKPELRYRNNSSGKEQVVPVILTDIGLLTVSKQVSREAAGIFYGHHIFHYSIKRRGAREPPAHLLKRIATIKHLSISYTATYPRSIRAQRIDTTIAQHIQFVIDNCNQLHTLNLHVIVTQMEGETFESVLRAGHTSEKLRSLHPRLDRLTLISFGPIDAFAEFRDDIFTPSSCINQPSYNPAQTPGSCLGSIGSGAFDRGTELPRSYFWLSYVANHWPHLRIPAWEANAMKDRQAQRPTTSWWSQGEEIRVWYLNKPSNRA